MLVGVDWGGTKIEAIAIGDDGEPVARLREATPRSDYEGCLATVASVVDRWSRKPEQRGPWDWNSRLARPAHRTSQGRKFHVAQRTDESKPTCAAR